MGRNWPLEMAAAEDKARRERAQERAGYDIEAAREARERAERIAHNETEYQRAVMEG